jgi:poly(A) polymerase
MRKAVYYTWRRDLNNKRAAEGNRSKTVVQPPAGETKIAAPLIIPRAEHPISRSRISENALKVLYRLKEAGYASCLVGGCVRDLWLQREPKDFDVVTDARPEEIRRLFRNARLIGRRFRLAHVRFGNEIIEVATFRGLPRTAETEEELLVEHAVDDPDLPAEEAEALARAKAAATARMPATVADQNVFGTQEEDALRRDFTVNALYYNIRDFTVVDYIGGVRDLEAGILRIIGDPETRYREDPVRMLRAVRFAAKLGFRIEEKTAAPIRELAPLLATVPPARLYEEVLKLFHGGYAVKTFELLRAYGLFRYLFPLTEEALAREEDGFPLVLVPRALAGTDTRIAEGKPVTPAFLFAALLWEPVRRRAREWQSRGAHPQEALARAADEVLREEMRAVAIPRRVSGPAREIWFLQHHFARRTGRRPFRLMENKRFRAAYDFLLLRAESGEAERELAEWWTRFEEADEAGRERMVKEAAAVAPVGSASTTRRRRRRRGRRRREPDAAT